jgi:hypothetical protein
MNDLNSPGRKAIRLALQLLVLVLIVSMAVMARAGKQLSSPGQSKSNTTKQINS